MDENHIDAETEKAIAHNKRIDKAMEELQHPMDRKELNALATQANNEIERLRERLAEIDSKNFDAELAKMDRAREEHVQRVTGEFAETRPVIQRPTAPDSMFVAETPLVYQKEFFGFLLTVTKNSVGILIELHTNVKASAVFGLCCRFLTGLGVPAAQIGGVEPIFSEWLPFPTPEA